MQKWEYLYVEVQLGGMYIERIMSNGMMAFDIKGKDKGKRMMQLHEYYNWLGNDGWELIAGHFTENRQMHIFKRPAP